MNAVLERVPFDTCGFSPALRFGISGVTTANESAAFSPKEKIDTAASSAGTSKGLSRLWLGSKAIAVTAIGTTAFQMPTWADVVIKSLPSRLGYFKGWDSYDAEPTRLEDVAAMLTNLFLLMQEDSKVPTITALPDGGVQAEWHNTDEDLEVVFRVGEPGTFYYFDGRTGEEDNGILASKIGEVRAKVQRF